MGIVFSANLVFLMTSWGANGFDCNAVTYQELCLLSAAHFHLDTGATIVVVSWGQACLPVLFTFKWLCSYKIPGSFSFAWCAFYLQPEVFTVSAFIWGMDCRVTCKKKSPQSWHHMQSQDFPPWPHPNSKTYSSSVCLLKLFPLLGTRWSGDKEEAWALASDTEQKQGG